jgi:hypothetical protein
VKRACQNAQKIVKIWFGGFKNIKIKIWQYLLTDDSPVDKENSI